MKSPKIDLAGFAMATLLALAPSSAWSHGKGGEKKTEKRPPDIILAEMGAMADSLDSVIRSGALKRVHDIAEPLIQLGHELNHATESLDVATQKRIAGGVKNLTKLADKAHIHADVGKAKEAGEDVAKIKAQIKLLENQTAKAKGENHEAHP